MLKCGPSSAANPCTQCNCNVTFEINIIIVDINIR